MGVFSLHAGKISHYESSDFESMFIKIGDSETKEGLIVEEATGERKRGQPGTNCHCPLLPWLPILWGPLEFRRKRTKIQSMGVL